MRTEAEMMELLTRTAEEDPRIRAVYMNGSRTNENVPKDRYRDYDIVYVVTETGSFLEDKDWVLRFGTPLIIQEPDRNDNEAGFTGEIHDFSKRYAFLMLFDDGNRIDLSLETKEEAAKNFLMDKLTITLLDKEGFLPQIPAPTDEDYRLKKPSKGEYLARCNEFWWCLNNVAKGIVRDELSYVKEMLEHYVRNELHKMMGWFIGTREGFGLSVGKSGKFFKKYLSEALYRKYRETYAGSDYEALWKSIFVMCDLFHELAVSVGDAFGFSYRQQEEDGLRTYLTMMKED